MFKVDGHTHTQFCPHGCGDHVENMIERAIQLGFEEYHITEHAPIPESFIKLFEPKEKALNDGSMPEGEVDRYIKEMLAVKEKYKNKIKIKVGFEVDYLPTEVAWSKNFLQEYGKYCDAGAGLISVHYMKGLNDWRCVDYKPDDVINHLIPNYGSLEDYQKAYYDFVRESVLVDLGDYKPRKIAHLTVVDKFKKVVGVSTSDAVKEQIFELLRLIKKNDYCLDYNHSGLFKPFYGETYPPLGIVQQARQLGIPLVYGSDAHGVEDVGRNENNVC